MLVFSLLPVGNYASDQPLSPTAAYADELADAKAALDSASSELSRLTQEYNDLQSEAAALNSEIEEAAAAATEAQKAMIEGQDALGEVIVQNYKDDGSLSLVNILLQSVDISDFLKNIEYFSSIQQAQAKQIEDQKKLRDEYNARIEELDARMARQDELLAQAEQKRTEAQQVVNDASAKVQNIESERARMAELEAKAKAMEAEQAKKQQEAEKKAQESQNSTPLSPEWNTQPGGDSSGGSGSGASGGNAGGSSAPSGGSVDTGSQDSWRSGVASAYGGSSDPNTPNPGHTATGAVCNDSSMGVAIPMSWPNYRSYFGRTVEIRFNGRTVLATVNDCGGMGGGSRSLDLQPGVFKALGYSTCQAWGLQTVQYRFL